VALALDDLGKVESQPMMEARTMTMVLAPRVTQVRPAADDDDEE
jgi:translation initiation factor IF-3